MHPILLIGLTINVMIVATFGGLGFLLLAGALVAISYNVIARDGGPANKHRGTIVAFGTVYLLAGYLILRAPWSTPEIDAVTVIMELFVFAIFSALGRR
uniref:Uncharacterized protein n=1 Tax=candidate division WWE3 bacterium TaxID=2053526 RepID=A0A7C4TLT4_UNCKA